jgi:class 3 adenylate cyclase
VHCLTESHTEICRHSRVAKLDACRAVALSKVQAVVADFGSLTLLHRVYGSVVAGENVPKNAESTLPTGIVTFLLTDVEGSTRLWAEDQEAMSASLQVHDRVLREAVESQGGYVFSTAGDSFAVAFTPASDAVAAAASAQARFGSESWPGPVLRVRMGLHLGEADAIRRPRTQT